LDALQSSHPIEVEVKHPDEIDEIFDEISYNKGACVIRMLYNYIGDADFRKGMNLYLTRHQYKNTETEDLWQAFSESAAKPVTEVMQNWVQKTGYPVVRVLKNVEVGKDRILTLSQEKFTADGRDPAEKTRWMIPIQISTPSQKLAANTIFDKDTIEITLKDVKPTDWVKVNPGTVGFYRTQYLPEMLEAFVSSGAIEKKILPPLDRLGLLDDLFALIQAGQVPTVQVLKLLDAFRTEDNYTVLHSCSSNLQKIQLLLSHTDFGADFDTFCIKLLSPIAEKLGWTPKEGESHLDTLLRPLILSRLISNGCEKTIKTAVEKFETEGTNVAPDLRQLVYKAVMQAGDDVTWEKMLGLYRAAASQEEKDRFGFAFGAARDAKVLQKVLDFSMSNEPRAIETVRIIAAAAVNPKGRDLSWTFFQNKAKEFQGKYEGGYLLSWLVKSLTENFASEEKAVEVEAFFKNNEFPGCERTVQQAVETIRLNTAWLNRDRDSLKEFLKH